MAAKESEGGERNQEVIGGGGVAIYGKGVESKVGVPKAVEVVGFFDVGGGNDSFWIDALGLEVGFEVVDSWLVFDVLPQNTVWGLMKNLSPGLKQVGIEFVGVVK